MTDITVKGSWLGPGRLHLVPHVNAPVADFPVRKIIGAHHFVADVPCPMGACCSTTTKNKLGLGLLYRSVLRFIVARHPEVAAKRPSKSDGPGRASFEARFARTSG